MSASDADLEILHIAGEGRPWIPFAPLDEEILLRYFLIDPTRGEIMASVRIAPGLELAPHYNTGTVVAHTVAGAWRHPDHDWISRAGDTVVGRAGSISTVQSVGDSDAVVFVVVSGELLFFDPDGSLVWQESWKTSMERETEYRADRLRRPGGAGV